MAAEDSDAKLDFRDLPVEVACHEHLTRKLHTICFSRNVAPTVKSAPSSPQSVAQILGCFDGFVPSNSSSAFGLPQFGVFALE